MKEYSVSQDENTLYVTTNEAYLHPYTHLYTNILDKECQIKIHRWLL